MAFSMGASIGKGSSSLDAKELIEYAEETDSTGIKIGQGKTSTVTENGGRSDAGKSTTWGNNKTDASQNVTVEGGSTSTTTNSGSVNTSQLMLSETAVNHMAKQMLEGTSGLAAIAKGQNASGGYNTTTQALLTSDMTSRIAGEVAARGAQRVDVIGESTSTTKNSGRTITQNIGATNQNTFNTTDTLNIIGSSTSKSDAITDSMDFTNTKNLTAGVKERETNEEKKETKKEAKSGWIICTELKAQGKMENRIYLAGLSVFEGYSDQSKKGYYVWAVPSVKHLKAHPDSWFSKLLEKVFVSRATYLFARKYPNRAKKTLGGFLITWGLYVGCVALSRTFAHNYAVDKETYNGVYNGV